MIKLSLAKRVEERFSIKNDSLPEKVFAIIAIGIDLSRNGTKASPYSHAVTERAAQLYHDSRVSHIICSGGYRSRPEGITEARGMSNVLLERGIPRQAIILEEESTRTFLNAQNTLQVIERLLRKGPVKDPRVVVVAQPWHARRVKRTFQRIWRESGIRIHIIKAPSEYGGGSQKRLDSFWKFLVWDTLAFIVSWLKGYALLPFQKAN